MKAHGTIDKAPFSIEKSAVLRPPSWVVSDSSGSFHGSAFMLECTRKHDLYRGRSRFFQWGEPKNRIWGIQHGAWIQDCNIGIVPL